MGSKASLWEVEPQPSQSMWEVEQPATQPRSSGSGLPPGEIPLTSYGAATMQGVANIGKGAIEGVEGAYNMVRHPIDTAQGLWNAPGKLIDQMRQVPGAISDINASPDPAGTYAKAAGETAGEGAGQAITAAAAPELPGMAKDAALNLPAKAKALGKVGAQEAISRIPVAGRLVRRPSIGDWYDAATAKAPGPDPTFSKVRLGPDNPGAGYLNENALRSRGLEPAPGLSKTRIGPDPAPTPNPVFSPVPLGPDAPSSDFLAFNKIRDQGLRPGGLRQPVSSRPMPQNSDALGQIPQPPSESGSAPVTRPPLAQQMRSLPQGQYEAPASPLPPQGQLGEGVYEGEYLDMNESAPSPAIRGQLPRGQYAQPPSSLPQPPYPGQPRLVDQIMERTTPSEPFPTTTGRRPAPFANNNTPAIQAGPPKFGDVDTTVPQEDATPLLQKMLKGVKKAKRGARQ